MKILSLFSGVGGLDLAVETLLGVETAIMCERDEYARKVLARHWPGVPIVDDVTQVGDVGADVICGGPPCQDVSVAGKQAAEKGTRWLWPEAVRVTRENRPRLCLWENVPGLLTADSGRAFAGVLQAFDAIGYATRWDHCEAAAAGAPHRRDRVFLVCVPVDRFRQPGPAAGRPVSMFGHADEPTWPRAGWYSAGRWGVERARFPKGRIAVQSTNWPTPDAGAANLDESSESWHARAATLKEKHGNGNGAGTPLAVAVRDADAGAWAENPGRMNPRNPDHVRRMVPTRKGDALRPETSEEYWSRQPAPEADGALWPTPRCGEGSMYPESDAANASRGGESVATAALKATTWPTPQAYSHNAEQSNAPGALKLDHAVWEATGDPRAAKSWPTPRSEDAELCGAHRGVPDTLLSAIRQASARTWPTPAAGDEKNTRNATANRDGSKGGQGLGVIGQTLCDAVEIESGKWPTPTAGDAEGGRTTTGGRDIPTSLNMAAKGATGEDAGLWPTPRASEGEKGVGPLGSASHDHNVAHGYLNATIQEATKSTGALNPAFSEWLQGFPPGWTEPDGPALPHVAHGHAECELTYYGGRPAPAGMDLLTTVKLNRRNRLKTLGNAVFARCAILALSELLPINMRPTLPSND